MMTKPIPEITPLSEPYWEAAANRQLVVQHCTVCQHRFLYARELCPKCWSTQIEWVPVSGKGSIIALTLVHQAPYPSYAEEAPYLIAVVRLDEGPQLMTNIIGDNRQQARIGSAVVVTFEQRGSVALPQFHLAEHKA